MDSEDTDTEDEVFSFTSDSDDINIQKLASDINEILGVKDMKERLGVLEDQIQNLEDRNLDDKISSIETEVESIHNELDDDIEDIREKIIQVAKMSRNKSNKNHHDNLENRQDNLRSTIEEVEDELDQISDEIDENRSEILEVSSCEEDLRDKTTRLAHSHLKLREEVQELQGIIQNIERENLKSLRNEAQNKSVNSAKCSECGYSVNISLLNEAKCPECNSNIEGIKKRRIRSNYLIMD